MMKISGLAACAALVALLVLNGCSGGGQDSGHEGMPEHHEGMMEDQGGMMQGQGQMSGHMEEPGEHGPAMEAQHDTMRTLAEQWMKARSAALGGNSQGVITPVTKMHDAATHIETFRLHRNIENEKEFLERAKEFNSLLMRFTTDAKQGDVEALRETAPKIDQACNDCHQAFR